MAKDILIVDDEADIRMLLAGLLSDEGYEPRQAANDRETFAAIARRRPELVILDIWLKTASWMASIFWPKSKKTIPICRC